MNAHAELDALRHRMDIFIADKIRAALDEVNSEADKARRSIGQRFRFLKAKMRGGRAKA